MADLSAGLRSRDVVGERLARQFLTTRGPADAAGAVHALAAVQAQDCVGAKWAVALRTRGATDAEVEQALSDGSILRTHVLRPTWHFVHPGDIRWMLALTAPRVKAAMAYYDRKLELTPAVYRRSNAAIVRALRDGEHLTRAELARAIQGAGVAPASGQHLGHLMLRAELEALVCSGRRRGKQFTYALLDERVPPMPALGRDEALLELTRRYFATRGPASARDFAWWSGLTMRDVKRGLELAASELQRVRVEGRDLWRTGREGAPGTSSAHLLPNYDEYVVGYKDRGAIARRLGDAQRGGGANLLFSHVALMDGELVGSWTRTLGKGTVVVDLTPLTRLTPGEEPRIGEAAKLYGDFLGTSVDLRIGAFRA